MAKEPITVHRKLLGYMDADRKKPIFAAMPGALVTHAFIHCCECREPISSNMGPRRNAWCIECTAEEEKAAVQRKKEELEQERLKRIEKRKKKEEEEKEKQKKQQEEENRFR